MTPLSPHQSAPSPGRTAPLANAGAGPPRLDSLEALRGIAAFIVVLHHACGTMGLAKNYHTTLLGDLFEPGQLGVDIFFVLSGFIIFWTNPGEALGVRQIGRFYLRRIFRIYPTYWLICLFVIPAVYLNPSMGDPRLERDLPTALHSLLLLPHRYPPVLGPAWSLCFEVMFYAGFAALLIHRRTGWLLWAGWAALGVGLKAGGVELENPYLRQLLSELVLLFFLGMMVAWAVRRQASLRYAGWALGGGAVVLGQWYLEWQAGREALPWRHVIYGGGAALLIYGLASLDVRKSPRVPAFWAALGLYSYSIYLIHRPVQQALVKVAVRLTGTELPPAALYGVLLAVVVISVLAGVALGRYVEQPSLRWLKRWTEPARRPEPSALGRAEALAGASR